MADSNYEDLFNSDVIDVAGNRIGGIGQVYLDDQTGQPSWVTVKTGLFGLKETFVPLEQAEIGDGRIRVPYTAERVKDAPRVDPDKHLDADEEAQLYEYYGIATIPADDSTPIEPAERMAVIDEPAPQAADPAVPVIEPAPAPVVTQDGATGPVSPEAPKPSQAVGFEQPGIPGTTAVVVPPPVVDAPIGDAEPAGDAQQPTAASTAEPLPADAADSPEPAQSIETPEAATAAPALSVAPEPAAGVVSAEAAEPVGAPPAGLAVSATAAPPAEAVAEAVAPLADDLTEPVEPTEAPEAAADSQSATEPATDSPDGGLEAAADPETPAATEPAEPTVAVGGDAATADPAFALPESGQPAPAEPVVAPEDGGAAATEPADPVSIGAPQAGAGTPAVSEPQPEDEPTEAPGNRPDPEAPAVSEPQTGGETPAAAETPAASEPQPEDEPTAAAPEAANESTAAAADEDAGQASPPQGRLFGTAPIAPTYSEDPTFPGVRVLNDFSFTAQNPAGKQTDTTEPGSATDIPGSETAEIAEDKTKPDAGNPVKDTEVDIVTRITRGVTELYDRLADKGADRSTDKD